MRRGFTLIETIIYTALVVLVLASAVLATQATLETRGRTRAELLLEEQMRFALTRVTDTIRTANAVNLPAAAGETGSTLTLSVPEGPANPTTFTITNGALTVSEGGGAPLGLTSATVRITDFTVTRLAGDPTPLMITLGGATGFERHSAQLTITAIAIPQGDN